MDDAPLTAVIAAAYDAALEEEGWPALLARLAQLFRSHFADVFARAHDHGWYGGLAHGLDEADYQDQFLDTWVMRNVWGKRRPTRIPGEVVSTRQIMPKAELVRSEMYNEYLAPRGLHEGLRLTLAVTDGWVQDISLLRPWSAGPFTATEIRAARSVLPHLQRAAAVSRRLREAEETSRLNDAVLDALGCATFVLDGRGALVSANRAGDALLRERDGLALAKNRLQASHGAARPFLAEALAQAAGAGRTGTPLSGTLRLPRLPGRGSLTLTVMPLGAGRTPFRAPAVLVLADDAACPPPDAAHRLTEAFGLTAAEAGLATRLLAGDSLAEIARNSERSIHTVRTHLARVMSKTQTRKQGTLMRELIAVARPQGAAALPLLAGLRRKPAPSP